MSKQAPKRAIQITVEAGADDKKSLIAELTAMINEIRAMPMEGTREVATGGCNSGMNYTVTFDNGMTNDRYYKELEEFLFGDDTEEEESKRKGKADVPLLYGIVSNALRSTRCPGSLT